MSALTRSNSGRAVLVALLIGLIGAMMAIALFPADAATESGVSGSDVDRVSGDACETLGFPGKSFAFDVPKGASNDQSRVFDETYDLEDGASVEVRLPSNRSYMNFDMTGASVSAVVVFGRNNQRDGTLYEYDRDLVTGLFPDSDTGLVLNELYSGNIKSVTLCYDTSTSFLCDVPVTESDPSLHLSVTFIRFGEDEECGEFKFGKLDFSIAEGEDVIQFAPSLDGSANFVGELTYDVAADADFYDILYIDDSLHGDGEFFAMEWYEELDSIDYDGVNGAISGADFKCPNEGEWCILSATIDKGQIVWVIGGPLVDPRFR
jgi:hypothetical protein